MEFTSKDEVSKKWLKFLLIKSSSWCTETVEFISKMKKVTNNLSFELLRVQSEH